MSVNRKSFLTPQNKDDLEFYEYIEYTTQFPEDLAKLDYYILRLFARQGPGTRTKYAQIYLGYCE